MNEDTYLKSSISACLFLSLPTMKEDDPMIEPDAPVMPNPPPSPPPTLEPELETEDRDLEVEDVLE